MLTALQTEVSDSSANFPWQASSLCVTERCAHILHKPPCLSQTTLYIYPNN